MKERRKKEGEEKGSKKGRERQKRVKEKESS